jgi:hypothetical protein
MVHGACRVRMRPAARGTFDTGRSLLHPLFRPNTHALPLPSRFELSLRTKTTKAYQARRTGFGPRSTGYARFAYLRSSLAPRISEKQQHDGRDCPHAAYASLRTWSLHGTPDAMHAGRRRHGCGLTRNPCSLCLRHTLQHGAVPTHRRHTTSANRRKRKRTLRIHAHCLRLRHGKHTRRRHAGAPNICSLACVRCILLRTPRLRSPNIRTPQRLLCSTSHERRPHTRHASSAISAGYNEFIRRYVPRTNPTFYR